MLAELRFIIVGKEARLLLKVDGQEVEDEIWTMDGKITKSEAAKIANCVFQDAYEVMQYAAHGHSIP
jgi:hypothetical protein